MLSCARAWLGVRHFMRPDARSNGERTFGEIIRSKSHGDLQSFQGSLALLCVQYRKLDNLKDQISGSHISVSNLAARSRFFTINLF
jgi:hypothetical protein